MDVRERYDRETPTDAGTMNDIADDMDKTEDALPVTRKRRWPWAVGILVVVGGAAAAVTMTGGSDDVAETAPVTFSFAETVRTDLVQVDTFDGTIGTIDTDPIKTQMTGTVTDAAAAGSVVEQGETLFAINDELVVLAYGETPAYRDLRISEDTLTLTAQSAGTVTDIVEPGTTLEQGDVIYRINGEPVVVMYGNVPAYRAMSDLRNDNMMGTDVLQLEEALTDLGYDPDGLAAVDEEFSDYTETLVELWQADIGAVEDGVVNLGEVIFVPGPVDVLEVSASVGDQLSPGRALVVVTDGEFMAGTDVLQLETALSDLGYDDAGLAVDGVFDEATKQAVLDWQTDSGIEADGVVNLGEIIFQPGPVRIGDQLAAPGSSVNPGSPVLAISSADKVVTFNLPAADQDILAIGDSLVVELPDGSEVPATVTDIATVATISQDGNAAFEVTIALDDPTVATGLDEAPVDIEVVSDSVQNVVAVPVASLLALAEGGYAVEVDAGNGTTRLVAVDPGFYADSMVEVTSTELQPGDLVVVP